MHCGEEEGAGREFGAASATAAPCSAPGCVRRPRGTSWSPAPPALPGRLPHPVLDSGTILASCAGLSSEAPVKLSSGGRVTEHPCESH